MRPSPSPVVRLQSPPDEPWNPTDDDAPDAPPQSRAANAAAPPESPFRVIDAPGIFAPLEPIRYVVQALDLCPGAPAMWAGYGYSGKTAAAQSAAIAIAGGVGKVWDCFSAGPGNVMHIDYEQGSRLTRERYQRLAVPHMLGPSDLDGRLSLVTMPTLYLDDPKAETELERLVADQTLVIIDSLRAAAPTLDENASEVRTVLDMLSRVSERTGAAFVVIHHARKPQQNASGGAKMAIRGSGALFDACSSVLVFEGEKGQPTRVSHEKARTSGRPVDDFEITITDFADEGNERAGLLVSASSAADREARKDDAERERLSAKTERIKGELRELFAQEPDQPGADTIASLIHRKPADVRPVLNLLVEAGEVERTGKGRAVRHLLVRDEIPSEGRTRDM